MAMEQMGNIIGRSSGRQAASGADNDAGIVIKTEAEARKLGIRVDKPQPPDEKCEFCGKVLHHEGLNILGSISFWSPFAERCTCEQARKKWEKHDEEERKRQEEENRRNIYKSEQAKIERMVGKSGINKRFQYRIFQTFKTDTPARKKAYDIAKAYADNFSKHLEDGTGLYIEGTNGSPRYGDCNAVDDKKSNPVYM